RASLISPLLARTPSFLAAPGGGIFSWPHGGILGRPPTGSSSQYVQGDAWQRIEITNSDGWWVTIGPVYYTFFEIDDIVFGEAPHDLNLVVRDDRDPSKPSELIRRKPQGDVKVKVPLGTRFTVSVIKAGTTGDPILTSYAYRGSNVRPWKGTRRNRHLFPDVTVVSIGESNPGYSRSYMAVHLGSTTVDVLPLIEGGDPFTLTFEVAEPDELGGTQTMWEKMFVVLAHETGLPPQYMKGQAQQEAANGRVMDDPLNYRYEPCSQDLDYVSRGTLRINDFPYNEYAFDEDLATMPNRTADMRNLYHVSLTRTKDGLPLSSRQIVSGELGVTAKEMFLVNDKRLTANVVSQNWSNDCDAWSTWIRGIKSPTFGDKKAFADANLNFPAQTATAASYGVYQMTYVTARDLGWYAEDSQGNRSYEPYLLFDTVDSHRWTNGGSFHIAGQRLVQWGPRWPKSFESFAAYEERVRVTMQSYNEYKTGYGQRIVYVHAPALTPTGSIVIE
ncbi:MAG: hypothetical protein ACYC60_21630, partial [Thermoanaerobaculia bacterium]